jgi:hypothetical protein
VVDGGGPLDVVASSTVVVVTSVVVSSPPDATTFRDESPQAAVAKATSTAPNQISFTASV